MATLTQEEYQQKIAGLKTPQEITAFVKKCTIAEGESTLVKRGRPKKFIDPPAPSPMKAGKSSRVTASKRKSSPPSTRKAPLRGT